MSIRKKALYISYGAAISEEILRRSHYVDVGGVLYVFYALLALACGAAFLKTVLDFVNGKLPRKCLVVFIAGAAYFVFLFLRGQFDAVMLLWVFIAASWDCDFKKLVKICAVTTILTLVFVYLSSAAGIIDNTVKTRMRDEVEYNRNGIGFIQAYQAQYFLFFSQLAWFYWRKEKLTWYEMISFAAIVGLIYWQSDTRGPFYLSCILTAAAAVLKLLPQLRKCRKLYEYMAIVMPPLSALLVYVQGKFVKPTVNEFWREFNEKMTTRLQLNYDGLHKYGVSFFGKPIEWIAGLEGQKGTYNWVDSVYLYSLLSYGIPFIAGFFAITTYLGIKAWKKRDTYMMIALILIAVLGLWDNYCFRVECNPFYLFFAYAGTKSEEELYI